VIPKNREFLVGYLQSHPCVDCNNSDLRVLEFDHVRGTKKDGVAQLARQGVSLKALKEEIGKCEVRCRNCHAIKTYERMGGSWHDSFLESS
jgi:hypothetical protein